MKMQAAFIHRHTAAAWITLCTHLRRPWFAYLTIFVLQLKRIWGMWYWHDLSPGDTSCYFNMAQYWFHHFKVNILWSPLYTAYYGSFRFLLSDRIYLLTMLHRMVIVLVAVVLLLAVLRRLLPPALAWLTAAWWAVLPINFNTIFEVHLFALLPILLVWLVIQWRDTPWCRGSALALLALSAVLVRNELVVAVGLLALICLLAEIRQVRQATRPVAWRTYLQAYGTPMALSACVVVFFYSRSICKGAILKQGLSDKHTVNMGQVFAFGYQQRHPEWTHSPWTEFQPLMTEYFGNPQPTLRQMLWANPQAVLEHFSWNLHLAPNGLQVLLFNGAFGHDNPDYPAPQLDKRWALQLSLVCITIWITAAVLLVRHHSYWWTIWLRDRALTWSAMFAVAAVTVPVILTQRPRPSYLFALGVLLMSVTAMSLCIIIDRLRCLPRLERSVPIVMVAFCVGIPGYFASPAHRLPYRIGLPVERLTPYRDLLASPQTRCLAGDACFEMTCYLADGLGQGYPYTLLDAWNPQQPLDAFLEARGINFVYLDETLLARLETHASTASAFLWPDAGSHWKLIGAEDSPCGRWKLFQRKGSGAGTQAPVTLSRATPRCGSAGS